MPTIPSLLGSYIDQTYQRLVQVSGSSFADGLGNPITLPGSVNPTSTYLPFNNVGTFQDSFLNQPTTGILKTTSASVDIGLYLDFANSRYYLGDPVVNRNGTCLMVSDSESIIKTFSGSADGLELNFQVRTYKIGDFNGNNNSTILTIDDANQIIKTTNQGNDIGLKLDFANNVYTFGKNTPTQIGLLGISSNSFDVTTDDSNSPSLNLTNFNVSLGDFQSTFNGTSFFIDETNSLIKTKYGNTDRGLNLDFANNKYQIGNFNSGSITITESQVQITGSLTQNGYEVKPYKVYTALLTQSGAGNDPTAIVLENTLGPITYQYSSVGRYIITSSGLFTTDKTFILIGNAIGQNPGELINFKIGGDSSITLWSRDNAGSGADDILLNTPIEIRVYN